MQKMHSKHPWDFSLSPSPTLRVPRTFRLLAALSCSLFCTVAELLGFLSGLSMFTALPALFCILMMMVTLPTTVFPLFFLDALCSNCSPCQWYDNFVAVCGGQLEL